MTKKRCNADIECFDFAPGQQEARKGGSIVAVSSMARDNIKIIY